jgi:hypothetical protein
MECYVGSLTTDVPLRWFSGKVVGRNNPLKFSGSRKLSMS